MWLSEQMQSIELGSIEKQTTANWPGSEHDAKAYSLLVRWTS